jgi:SAM-dependent methyltransferase
MSSVSPAALFDELLARRPVAALRRDDGRVIPLDIGRWLGPTCVVDETIAAAADGPVLDIGCGPGRLLDALSRRGTWALGLDASAAAVELARSLGRSVVLGDVFDTVPRAGEWATALLLDGSVGIGGDPVALLARVRTLLAAAGTAIVEVEPPGAGTHEGRVRLEVDDVASRWFDWAHVDADGIAAVAAAAGLTVRQLEALGGRWFAWLD